MQLKYIAVGTGRDGTVSLTQVLNEIFKLNGIDAVAAHEYLSRDCYEAYCSYKEDGDSALLEKLRRQIIECPYDAIVGNGYASLLGLFRELAPDAALIHLKRLDRGATIESHLRNSQLFPETYVYYGAPSGVMRRTAAFHEGEMSRGAWDALSLHERFAWFYDYTHRRIDEQAKGFTRRLDLHTEDLSRPESLAELTRFILQREGSVPGGAHLNRHVYLAVDDFSKEGQAYSQWLCGTLSAPRIEKDYVYFSDYVTNKFVALTGYQISGFVREFAPSCEQAPAEVFDNICRFEALMAQRLREAQLLKADFLARYPEAGKA